MNNKILSRLTTVLTLAVLTPVAALCAGDTNNVPTNSVAGNVDGAA